jgi:hypothetical protein
LHYTGSETHVWAHLRMFQNEKISPWWILLKLVLGDVIVNLHILVSSMNRLNLSLLSFWAFFRDSDFLNFIVTSMLLVPFGGRKKSPLTFNQKCYIFDPWRSFSTALLMPAFKLWLLTSFLWYAGLITSDPLSKFNFI